jgi:hypothetical protein
VQFDPVVRDALLAVEWIEERNSRHRDRDAYDMLPENRAVEMAVNCLPHLRDVLPEAAPGRTLRVRRLDDHPEMRVLQTRILRIGDDQVIILIRLSLD